MFCGRDGQDRTQDQRKKETMTEEKSSEWGRLHPYNSLSNIYKYIWKNFEVPFYVTRRITRQQPLSKHSLRQHKTAKIWEEKEARKRVGTICAFWNCTQLKHPEGKKTSQPSIRAFLFYMGMAQRTFPLSIYTTILVRNSSLDIHTSPPRKSSTLIWHPVTMNHRGGRPRIRMWSNKRGLSLSSMPTAVVRDKLCKLKRWLKKWALLPLPLIFIKAVINLTEGTDQEILTSDMKAILSL